MGVLRLSLSAPSILISQFAVRCQTESSMLGVCCLKEGLSSVDSEPSLRWNVSLLGAWGSLVLPRLPVTLGSRN